MMSCGSWLLTLPFLVVFAAWFWLLYQLGLDEGQQCLVTVIVMVVIAWVGRKR